MRFLVARKDIAHLENRKIHKGISLLGGLVGFMMSTLLLYFLGSSRAGDIGLMIFTIFPLAGVAWFSIFDKEPRRNLNEDWDFGRSEQKISKFDKPLPTIDIFGVLIGILFTYLSVYLSEVLLVTNAYLEVYPEADYLSILLMLLQQILFLPWANQHLLRYWMTVTFFIILIFGSIWFFTLYYRKKSFNKGTSDR